jgi:hypothetical protein
MLRDDATEFAVMHVEQERLGFQLAQMIDFLGAPNKAEDFGTEKAAHDQFAHVMQQSRRESLGRHLYLAKIRRDFHDHGRRH